MISKKKNCRFRYAAAGVFFKYAHDVYGLYGGNEAAAKAAGHEARCVVVVIVK